MIGGDNPDTVVSTNPIIFIGSAVFAYVTVLCSSCFRPAGQAKFPRWKHCVTPTPILL